MKLDAHQHFWKYEPSQYSWIDESRQVLAQNYLPADLEPLLRATGFDGCMAVQSRQTLEESRWLLNLANEYPIIKGVVGWVDLRSEEVHTQLSELAENRKFVGVRHVVQDEADDAFMLRPDFLQGIERLAEFNLTYDILIFPKQLAAAIELVKKFPQQRFVLDHIGKPLIKDGLLSPWREEIQELARHGNVSCKVSGMVTEANWSSWETSELIPYLDSVFECFDEERVIFGSDWPVCTLAASYRSVFQIARDYMRQFSVGAQDKFFGLNAARIYAVPDSAP